MRYLLKIILWICLGFSSPAIQGQQIDNGLWNSGLAFSLTPADSNTSLRCKLLNQVIKINLYPGVAVVQSEYTLVSDSNFFGKFLLPDSPYTAQSIHGKIHPLSSQYLNISLANQEQTPIVHTRTKEGYHITLSLNNKDHLRLIIQQLIQTNQGLMAKDGMTRENNAFGLVFNNQGWIGQGDRKAYVTLKDKLNLIGIYGVSPEKMVLGDLTHLMYQYDISRDSVLLIWFEGAAADFKFGQKVMPYREALFHEMKKFDERSFKIEKFGVIDKNDFGTDKQSKLLSILYFIMFSVPWIILAVFILFLIFRKKKTKSTT